MSPRNIKCSIIKNAWHQQQEEKLQMCKDLWFLFWINNIPRESIPYDISTKFQTV